MKYLINLYNIITQPKSAVTLAVLELQEAERGLIESLTALDYAQFQVSFNEKRILRLRKYVEKNVQLVRTVQ